jgi:hypothetical protein
MPTALFRLAAVVALASTAFPVLAQEAPTLGLLYNTREGHSLTYRCEPVRAGQMSCEFVQTAVRLKSTQAELSKVLDQARSGFRSEKLPSAQECTTFRDISGILEGRKAAAKSEAMSSLSPVERADNLRIAKAFTAYCEKPTEENFVAIARVGHDRDRRTCSVSSNSYKQMFHMVSEPGAQPVFVAQSNPEGSCGAVQLSRFEPEAMTASKSNFLNWKYIARKAITNPAGELIPGVKCSGLDEKAYTYDWRSKEHQMSCDYVEFSPL